MLNYLNFTKALICHHDRTSFKTYHLRDLEKSTERAGQNPIAYSVFNREPYRTKKRKANAAFTGKVRSEWQFWNPFCHLIVEVMTKISFVTLCF